MNSGFNKAANSAGVKPSCFVAGTFVMAVAGMVAIEKIKSGDKVISTDPETMETSPKTVLETYIREVTTLVHLTVNGEEIVTTVDHPFYVKNQGFVKAGELIVGDELLDVNGNVLLVENFDVELTEKPVTVYNFQVEDFHTYHVSGFSVLVHNASDLYARGSFRRSARQKAESEAPRNSNGKMKCPTWGKEIPDKITINTKNGPVDRIGYDLDHYPETWAERKVKLQSLETTPTRTEVLDCYNSDLRVQCHECNIKHIFEGVKGDFAE